MEGVMGRCDARALVLTLTSLFHHGKRATAPPLRALPSLRPAPHALRTCPARTSMGVRPRPRPPPLRWDAKNINALRSKLSFLSPPGSTVRLPPPLPRQRGPLPGPLRGADHGGAGGRGGVLCVSFFLTERDDRLTPRRAPGKKTPPVSLTSSFSPFHTHQLRGRPPEARPPAHRGGRPGAGVVAGAGKRKKGRVSFNLISLSRGVRTHSSFLSPPFRASAPSSRCCGRACTCEARARVRVLSRPRLRARRGL